MFCKRSGINVPFHFSKNLKNCIEPFASKMKKKMLQVFFLPCCKEVSRKSLDPALQGCKPRIYTTAGDKLLIFTKYHQILMM